MSLAGTGEIVGTAVRAGRGVGAFNIIGIEHAEAIAAGAEAAGVPAVLQISENCVAYHGALEPLARAALAIARSADVPVAVHLDHARDEELVHRAAAAGIGSVMFDASALPYEQNVAMTQAVGAWCHARGLWVEAEIGEVGGKDGVHAPGVRTRPQEAAGYAAATGADGLAVAVGSSHAMLSRDAELDLALIRRIRAAVRGAAGAARILGRARRDADRRRGGGHDQDQPGHAAEQGVHGGGAGRAGGRPGAGGPAALRRRRAGGGHAGGHPPAGGLVGRPRSGLSGGPGVGGASRYSRKVF